MKLSFGSQCIKLRFHYENIGDFIMKICIPNDENTRIYSKNLKYNFVT